MPETVTLTHPDLPGRELTVLETAVQHYARSGWQRLEDAVGALDNAAKRRPAAKPDDADPNPTPAVPGDVQQDTTEGD